MNELEQESNYVKVPWIQGRTWLNTATICLFRAYGFQQYYGQKCTNATLEKSEENNFMPLILILFHVKGWKPALQ